jgi:hypothetical protein
LNGVDDALGTPAPTVSTVEIGDELTAFDSATGTALTLNRTASDLFALADGQTTVSEAVAVLARAYEVAPAAITEDVAAAVRELRTAGFLVASDI